MKLFLSGLLCLSSGCASLMDGSSKSKPGSKKKEGWSWFKKAEYQQPKSMVAIWTEDTLIQPGKPITRGFGGRIYFYNEKSQPIPVDGELIVYGFDDFATKAPAAGMPSDQELAAGGKKFRFTAEQFTQHFSHSDLGASYSVWIPWDAVGGEQKKITLMPTFIGKEQRIVRGEAAKLTLSGKTSAVAASQHPNNAVQLASASIPTGQPNALPLLSNTTMANGNSVSPNHEGMKVTTIRLNQPIHHGAAIYPAATPGINPPSVPLQMLQQQLGIANSTMPVQQSQQSPTSAMQPPAPIASGSSLAEMLPPLGHHIPPSGWIQQGPVQPVPNASASGSPLNPLPVPGQPAVR